MGQYEKEQASLERLNSLYPQVVDETENPAVYQSKLFADGLHVMLVVLEYLLNGGTSPIDELFQRKDISMDELMKNLQYAKDAVRYLLDHGDGLVDMHGLEHWASVVERTRKLIKEML